MENIKVALETLGCKLNQAETEMLAGQLAEAGYQIVSPEEKADIYILNTCTVTHVADRKSRHLLRMAHRRNPDARIIAAGCYAENDAKGLAKIEGVDLVLGNEAKTELRRHLGELEVIFPKKRVQEKKSPSTLVGEKEFKAEKAPGRTRSFVKAQDGCDNFCTYCVVPLVRGREKSLPAEQVINNIRQKVEKGYQEIVLTGTEIGSYDNNGLGLKGLLARILQETEIKRLRLSSLQPQELSPELVSLWRNPRLCAHFHLSLQSGSDTILRRMNRRYSTAEYAEKVNLIRSESPDAGITTDIITGFPGETDEEFETSYDFCRRMEFSRIHVFPYSRREGTRAADLPEQVAPIIKKKRSEKMLALAGSSLEKFQKRFLGRTQLVLFEQTTRGQWAGLTSNYIKVYIKGKTDLTNRLLPVKLAGIRADGMQGEIGGNYDDRNPV